MTSLISMYLWLYSMLSVLCHVVPPTVYYAMSCFPPTVYCVVSCLPTVYCVMSCCPPTVYRVMPRCPLLCTVLCPPTVYCVIHVVPLLCTVMSRPPTVYYVTSCPPTVYSVVMFSLLCTSCYVNIYYHIVIWTLSHRELPYYKISCDHYHTGSYRRHTLA